MNTVYILLNIGLLVYAAWAFTYAIRTFLEIRLINRAIRLLNRMQGFKLTENNIKTFQQIMAYLEGPHSRLSLDLAEELIVQEEQR